jgi:catalase-peroxidase
MTFSLTRLLGPLGVVLASMMLNAAPHAQEAFPSRPVRMVVPYPPGGIGDFVARLIAPKWSEALKQQIASSGLSGSELVRTTWAAAATFRGTDMRGGVNGARIRFAPQLNFAANDKAEIQKVLDKLVAIQGSFNKSAKGGKKVSLADLIVLAGNVGVEQAAKKAGVDVTVPFRAGRTDAAAEQNDAVAQAVLEPTADGFRNFYGKDNLRAPAEALIERANLLTLTVPEMTALVGGLRALDANSKGSQVGVLTARKGALTNDFFTNLLDMGTVWSKSKTEGLYEGKDRTSGKLKWTASPVDLIFGSNAELRATAEVYAQVDGQTRLVTDFVKAWTKVTELDRFDLR